MKTKNLRYYIMEKHITSIEIAENYSHANGKFVNRVPRQQIN